MDLPLLIKSPDVASCKLDLFDIFAYLLYFLSLVIELTVLVIDVWVQRLRFPNPKASVFVDSCLIVLSKLQLHQIIWQICDALWAKVFELKQGIGSSLIDSISPNVDFIFPFLCAKERKGGRGHHGCSSNQSSQKHEIIIEIKVLRNFWRALNDKKGIDQTIFDTACIGDAWVLYTGLKFFLTLGIAFQNRWC